MGNDRGGGFLTAVLVGALAGAAAVILLNEDTRKKVKRRVDKTVRTGEEEIDRLRSEIKKLKADLKEKAAEELEKASRKLAQR